LEIGKLEIGKLCEKEKKERESWQVTALGAAAKSKSVSGWPRLSKTE
jgi:hypothetical protein